MAKAKLKTQKTKASATEFINSMKDEQQRNDSMAILEMMKRVSGDEPKMWGSSIVGFGNIHLKYESGRELDWFKIGFSPRKQNLTLYGLGISGEQGKLLKTLGKHKTGTGCLYINKLSDIDISILKKIMEAACNKKK